jgi:hypothetical protein
MRVKLIIITTLILSAKAYSDAQSVLTLFLKSQLKIWEFGCITKIDEKVTVKII